MESDRWDRWTQNLSVAVSRRQSLASFGMGLGTQAGLLHLAEAKKRRKPLRFNELGCVNVGGKCRGKNAVCCSGICQGRKPRKGEKDRSRCVAHDASTCQAGQSSPICGPTAVRCTSTTGASGDCFTTTGNAPYCAANGNCFACAKDADCETVCGTGAACVRCPAPQCALGGVQTACASRSATPCNFAP